MRHHAFRPLLLAPLLGAVLGVPQAAHGQGGLSLALGGSHTQVRERALNDVVHQGLFAGPVQLRLDLAGPGRRQTFELAVDLAQLASRYESEPESFLFGLELSWRMTWIVPQPVAGLTVALGPAASAGSLFMVFSTWDDSHGYYLTAYSVGAAASLRYLLPRGMSLSLELSTPLLAVVARPESPIRRKADDPDRLLGRLHDNAGLTSIHRYRGVDLELGLALPRSAWLAPTLLYQLTYRSAGMAAARPLQVLSHSLALRVQLAGARSAEPRP